MDSEKVTSCPLHGAGADPQVLVGRRLENVTGAWHRGGDETPDGPVSVWLSVGQGASVQVTAGADWCLLVELSDPHEGYGMDDLGRVKVAPLGERTPFAEHLGEPVLAVREEHEPRTGRIALELTFASGRVRCESWGGELFISAR